VLVGVAGLARHDAGPMHDLKRARPSRTFAARLSFDTEYRPCKSVRADDDGTVPREACGTDDDEPIDPQEFAAGEESTDPDSLKAAALASLIGGDTTEATLDGVIAKLQKALRLNPGELPLLVDLSGAHLRRAERTQNPRDLVQGLSYALEALIYEPGNQAALFNAALALQTLAIDEEAVKAWDAYLAADPDSHWAAEARSRKRVLLQTRLTLREPGPCSSAAEVDSFAAKHPQEARLLGWDVVLGDWGRDVADGDPAHAALHLALAEKLGYALERQGGDASLADAVHAIHAASTDVAATQRLARAHRAFAAGQALYRANQWDAARDSFTRVVTSHAPSPVLLAWAAASGKGMEVFLGPSRYNPVFAALSGADSARHPALAARVQWMWGTRLLRRLQYPEARGKYEAAAHTFDRIGETEFFGFMLGLYGETAYEQGDTLAAYRYLHRALLTLRPYRSSIWLHSVLLELAHCAALDGMQWAALPIQDEDVTVAMRSGVPSNPLEALLARVKLHAAANQGVIAVQDLRAAVPLLGRVSRGMAHDWFAADLQYTRVLLARRRDPHSVAALDSAAAFFEKADSVWVPRVLTRRADTHLALGDTARATADLDSVTAQIRELSHREGNSSARAALIEEARSSFDQLVMLHVHSQRFIEALQALERGRVSFAPSPDTTARAGRGEPVGPPGEVAVEYALIGDTLLTWIVRGRDVHLLSDTLDRGEFVRTVEQVGAALERSAPSATPLPDLTRLYDWLVRPVLKQLAASDTSLVILADGEVAGVPFAALFDSTRKRYLVESHLLRFAATLADAARPALQATRPRPALLVADPAFNRRRHLTLDPLGGARAEVDALEPLYPGAMRLAGGSATRDSFVVQAQRASVIHYAGHAVFDDARPERSFLVLAGDGQLATAAVDSLDLSSVRVVVLSACRTLRSREGRSGGFAGLSGALLGAGAGGVVGSLWNVDDRRALPLMVAFHRELHSADPARALRAAQLRMVGSHDPALRSPATWAGFRYVGAAAPSPTPAR
jgi:CHAT domain-containing protein